MQPEIPEVLKAKLLENGVEDINEMRSLSATDLRDLGFSLTDICTIRRVTQTFKRPRVDVDEESSSSSDEEPGPKNGPDLLLAGLMEDPLGVRALLPSQWTKLQPHDMRGLLMLQVGRSENPYLHQEVDFLIQVVSALKSDDPGSLNIIIWARMVQVLLKAKYPVVSAEINGCWNAAFPKIKDLSDLSLTAQVLRAITLIEAKLKQKKPDPPPNTKTFGNPSFRSYRKY
jgi:hypothetical protein